MSGTLKYPLTGDDLIAIGTTVNDVTNRLKTLEDGEATEELMSGVYDVSVKISSSDDSEHVVGEVSWRDGWWAFYPYGAGE